MIDTYTIGRGQAGLDGADTEARCQRAWDKYGTTGFAEVLVAGLREIVSDADVPSRARQRIVNFLDRAASQLDRE